jgi:uncharacterized protein YukE
LKEKKMTNHNINDDRSIRELIADLAERQANTQTQLDTFLETANRVLARSAVLDDVVQELRDSTEQSQRNFEQHQRNFEEHQRTTNAALQSLEAILLQLIRIFPQA